MKTIEIFDTIIVKMSGIGQPMRKFLKGLLLVYLCSKGRYNYSNLSRWSAYDERSFRRNYRKEFDFVIFNRQLIEDFLPGEELLLVSDASFLPKSGRCTPGLGYFWSGCEQKSKKGLEVSALSVVCVKNGLTINICMDQTPATDNKESRLDFYLQQVRQQAPELPVRYWVADGFYAKEKSWQTAKELNLFLITKLRQDANLQIPFEGEQKGRGRKRTNGGKVNWKAELEPQGFTANTIEGTQLFSRLLWSTHWKRMLKVVQVCHKEHSYLLACSDLELPAQTILKYYQLRFQIEFSFRDAKQHLGLTHCQSRNQKAMHFHFNSVMMTLNLALLENHLQQKQAFSLQDIKTKYFNLNWMERIIQYLELDPEYVKKHPNFDKLLNTGALHL